MTGGLPGLVVADRRSDYQALLAGRAVDLRGRPVADLTVSCARPGTDTRVTSGGWFARGHILDTTGRPLELVAIRARRRAVRAN